MSKPGILPSMTLRALAVRYARMRDLDALDELDRREEEMELLRAQNKRLQEQTNKLTAWINAQKGGNNDTPHVTGQP